MMMSFEKMPIVQKAVFRNIVMMWLVHFCYVFREIGLLK